MKSRYIHCLTDHYAHLLAVNQGNHQNFDPSLIPQVALSNFHRDEAKKKIEKKIQNGRLKKPEFMSDILTTK